MRKHHLVALAAVMWALTDLAVTQASAALEGVTRITLLPPSPENPRNSEGDFIKLSDGRIMLVYTHFTGGSSDFSDAHLAGRYSDDAARIWTSEDVLVQTNQSQQTLMSVSLLRLTDGRIALFYLVKNSIEDCRPVVCFSDDEAETWSDPTEIIQESQIGYYVLNNDRVIQLDSGRLVAPVSLHDTTGGVWTEASMYGTIMCYCSDDAGATWHRSETQQDGTPQDDPAGTRVILQEPGVVALQDGRLMMFVRTAVGRQYVSYSEDNAETWTPFVASNIPSPRSPASIERIPSTGDLLLVWNNNSYNQFRTPFNTAISRDEGATWTNMRTIENDPSGCYCYTAIHFEGNHVLLAHCAGDRTEGSGLETTQITLIPIEWLYEDLDDPGMLGHWKFNEASGTTATDSSAYGHDGTLINGGTWITGKFNGALDASGTAYVLLPTNTIPATDEITVAGWFKTTATASPSVLFSFEGGCLTYLNTGGVLLPVFDGASAGSVPMGGGYNDGVWHHLAAVNNGITTTLYIDGVQIGQQGESLYNVNNLNRASAIGAQYSGTTPFDGSLDDWKVYGEALSEKEIRLLAGIYTGTLTIIR